MTNYHLAQAARAGVVARLAYEMVRDTAPSHTPLSVGEAVARAAALLREADAALSSKGGFDD